MNFEFNNDKTHMSGGSFLPIDEVLYLIRNSYGKHFTIEFVRSTGREIGTIKKVQCIYGAKTTKSICERPKKSANSWMHKDHDTIPLVNLETEKPLTPLISHIIGFNQYKISH